MEGIPLRVVGLGRYLPDQVVTAAELDERMRLPAGWVMGNTGVAERRWANGETPVEMAAAAVADAVSRADATVLDFDTLIYASSTPHQGVPDTAALLLRELGRGDTGTRAFSVHSTCMSFLAALEVAAGLLAAGRSEGVMIATAETPSLAADFDEPESAALLGDMATAVAVRASSAGEASELRSLVLSTFGNGADLCRIEGGGVAKHALFPSTKREDYLFHMDGPRAFRMAYRLLPGVLGEALEGAGVGLDDVSLVVPHQASLRGVRLIQRAFGVGDDRVMINLDRFGNCVAASIPGALYDAVADRRIARGDVVLLVGTGAGLTVGAGVLIW